MKPQAVVQGECTECEQSEDNYTVENRGLGDAGIGLELSCECGTDAVVAITENGLAARENISHEDASWNQSDEAEA